MDLIRAMTELEQAIAADAVTPALCATALEAINADIQQQSMFAGIPAAMQADLARLNVVITGIRKIPAP